MFWVRIYEKLCTKHTHVYNTFMCAHILVRNVQKYLYEQFNERLLPTLALRPYLSRNNLLFYYYDINFIQYKNLKEKKTISKDGRVCIRRNLIYLTRALPRTANAYT